MAILGLWVGIWFYGAMDGPPTASELIARSIAFHDPQSEWQELWATFSLRETRPGGEDRDVTLVLDVPRETFGYVMVAGADRVEKTYSGGTCEASLNGKTEFSEQESSQWRLSCEAIKGYFHYYLYLYGLPMKLRDPGTQISEMAMADAFLGQDVWSVKVTYAEEVGSDVWYFYFHKETAQLVGCRFFHNEELGDGEYIQFEGLQRVLNMQLPKNRKWFTNKEKKFLGSDHLEAGNPITERLNEP